MPNHKARYGHNPPGYKAYLLRLWQSNMNSTPVWRASLEDTQTGVRHGFASLTELNEFLKKQLEEETS